VYPLAPTQTIAELDKAVPDSRTPITLILAFAVLGVMLVGWASAQSH
jgi:hypothetical protein